MTKNAVQVVSCQLWSTISHTPEIQAVNKLFKCPVKIVSLRQKNELVGVLNSSSEISR